MIFELHYGDDCAEVFCTCRVTRTDSPQEFVYKLTRLVSKWDTVFPQQHQYFFPGYEEDGYAKLGGWAETEEEARQQAIEEVIDAFDEFNGWPQYLYHAYLPGETYDGDEEPTPPGQDPRAN
jgi:hypothetical protein